MTTDERINKAVLLSMIPHIVKANRNGLDADSLEYLIKKERHLRASVVRQMAGKPQLKIVDA